MIRTTFIALCLLIAGLGPMPPARASGPFLPDVRFYSYSGIDSDSETAFFKGRLGIIRPTFSGNRLYAAYRVLLGHPFTDDQARQLLASCCDIRPPYGTPEMQAGWLDARATVIPDGPKPDLDPYRRTKDYQEILNCFPSAFDTAAATLKARAGAYGAKDRWVIEWVKGQDAVFANCARTDLSLPADDPPDTPAWFKADRAYQRAASYFYHGNYPEARQRFAAIAKDAASPWAGIAPYLVARASLRLAQSSKTAEAVAQAKQEIAALQPSEKPSTGTSDIGKLTSALAFTRPDERIATLEQALLAPNLPDDLAASLHDFLLLADAKDAPSSDLGDWIQIMQESNSDAAAAAKEKALRHWQRNPSLPWLVAALAFLGPKDADAAAAIEQSRKLDPSSPGYLDAAWQRIRLLIGQGQSNTAVTELDKILADTSLTIGARNLFLIERAHVARNWDEFARFAPRRAEFLGPYYAEQVSDRSAYVTLPVQAIVKHYASLLGWRSELLHDPHYFDTDGAMILDTDAPLAILARIAQDVALPDNLRRDLALAAWTRAVLLDRDDIALPLSENLARDFPQYAAEWQRYREATAADVRRFAAARLLLRFPAAEPWVENNLGYTYKRDVIGSYASRWWSPESLKSYSQMAAAYFSGPCSDSCSMPGWLGQPAFVSDTDRSTAQDEFARIRQTAASAADYLGGIVLDWAKAHPDDPQVPEALHLVVRLTQYGDAGNHGISRRAYDLLHGAYPKSTWTKQTPFWYGK